VTAPIVAIVGRPNVGKSSLFNALAGRRIAIVDPTAGVTRDRISSIIEMDSHKFELVDTGGIGIQDADGLTALVEEQIRIALDKAQVILLVVDGRAGLTSLDEQVADRLRPVEKPIIITVNKCDAPGLDGEAAEFYMLGYERLVRVSAQQKRGLTELLDLISKCLPHPAGPIPSVEPAMKLAIVGRRNTGKSTFINSLAESQRVIVSETPGTTRDSIDVRFERDGKAFIAIDTAGVRRKQSIAGDIEFYSLARAERSIRRADVVLLFFDAGRAISKVDKQLADYVLEQFKPAIFVVNKWDLVAPTPTGQFAKVLHGAFPSLDYVPISFITAKNGRNVFKVLNLAQNLFKQAGQRASTGDLNRILRTALEEQTPPMRQNRRPKIYYATQVAVYPPTIVVFANEPSLFDQTYQRFLLRAFRDRLPFADVPIKLYLRRRQRGGETTDLSERAAVSQRAERDTKKQTGLNRRRGSKQQRQKPELWKDV
jgi:GTP-binding protein